MEGHNKLYKSENKLWDRIWKNCGGLTIQGRGSAMGGKSRRRNGSEHSEVETKYEQEEQVQCDNPRERLKRESRRENTCE